MTDKAIYRRSGMRTFYKVIDNKVVIRVTNKESFSQVDVSENRFVIEDATDETSEITGAEFGQAFNLAMDRIKNERV